MSDDLFEDDYMNGTAEELAHGKKEVVEMPDKEFPESTVENTLAETLADCIKTARQAYTIAGENPSSEDLRALAITIFIDMGKDKRTAQIGNKAKVTPRAYPAPTGTAFHPFLIKSSQNGIISFSKCFQPVPFPTL